jgi:hypothetical protein
MNYRLYTYLLVVVIIEADNDRYELLDGWIVVEYINHSENADIASCIVKYSPFCEVVGWGKLLESTKMFNDKSLQSPCSCVCAKKRRQLPFGRSSDFAYAIVFRWSFAVT